jgi:transposase
MNQFNVVRVPARVVNVAFDVSAETLNWTFIVDQLETSGECLNRTGEIRGTLKRIHQLVEQQAGPCELRVICESTGVYHRSLLKVAGQLRMRTSIASGEAVANCRKHRPKNYCRICGTAV